MQVEGNVVVAGHQPNFFPWFGYFEKILKSDIFVFSDDVQYPKQSVVNRVEIPISGQPSYLTLPVKKGNDQRIADKQYINDDSVIKKLVKTIKLNLGGYDFFEDLVPILDEFFIQFYKNDSISELNVHMNSYIATMLGITTTTKLGTELNLEEYHRNDRLIRRCNLLNSTIYLCGQGADGYQNEAKIRAAGILLKKIDYSIGKNALGADLKYSILLGIAKYGIECLRKHISEWYCEKQT